MITIYRDEAPTRMQEAIDWGKTLLFDYASEVLNQPGNPLKVEDAWIAGGSLISFFLGDDLRDVDVFTNTTGNLALIDETFSRWVWTQVQITPHAATYEDIRTGIRYDIVKSFLYDSPEETLEAFDFTVACCALTADTIVYHKDYFQDMATRSLVWNNSSTVSTNPVLALYRFQKYVTRGYTMDQKNLKVLAEALTLVEYDDVEETPLEAKSNPIAQVNIKGDAYARETVSSSKRKSNVVKRLLNV